MSSPPYALRRSILIWLPLFAVGGFIFAQNVADAQLVAVGALISGVGAFCLIGEVISNGLNAGRETT